MTLSPLGLVLGLLTHLHLPSFSKTMYFQSLCMLLVDIPQRTVSLLDLSNSNELFLRLAGQTFNPTTSSHNLYQWTRPPFGGGQGGVTM